MQKYPTMLYKGGDTAAEYMIAADESEEAALRLEGFAPPGEAVSSDDAPRRRGRPPSNG